jgi:hypothetical protein
LRFERVGHRRGRNSQSGRDDAEAEPLAASDLSALSVVELTEAVLEARLHARAGLFGGVAQFPLQQEVQRNRSRRISRKAFTGSNADPSF